MTTIDERLDTALETLSAEAFIFGNYALGKGVPTPLPDDNHELPPVDKAKATIRTIFLDLIAEANPLKPRGNSIVMAQKPYMNGVADFENNLIQAINGGKK